MAKDLGENTPLSCTNFGVQAFAEVVQNLDLKSSSALIVDVVVVDVGTISCRGMQHVVEEIRDRQADRQTDRQGQRQ